MCILIIFPTYRLARFLASRYLLHYLYCVRKNHDINNNDNNNNFINLLKKAFQLNLQCQISKT